MVSGPLANYILYAEDGTHDICIIEKKMVIPFEYLSSIENELHQVAFSGSYNDLYDKPYIKNFSGSYNDLSNKPFTSDQLTYLTTKLPNAIQFDSSNNTVFQGERILFSNLKSYSDFTLQSKTAALYPYLKSEKPAFSFYANTSDTSKTSARSFLDIIYDRSLGGVVFSPTGNANLLGSYKTYDGYASAYSVTITNDTENYEKVFTFYCTPDRSMSPEDTAEVVKFARGNVECESVILKSSTPGSTKKFKITVDDTGTLSATEVTE